MEVVRAEEGETNQEVKYEKYLIVPGNWKIVALGPVAVLTMFSITLTSEATNTIGLDKICRRTWVFGFQFCNDLREQRQVNFVFERNIRDVHARHLIWKGVVESFFACIILAFLGGWSDRTGRVKAILLLPIIGTSVKTVHGFANILLLFELPVESFLFFDAVFSSIVGPSVVFFGLFTYEFDNTTAENRLYRFGTLVISALAGVIPGLIFHNVLMRSVGYFGVYVFACIANVVNYIYINNHLEESFKTSEQILYDNTGYKETLRIFFDSASIRETVAVLRKKTPEKRNVHMYVILVTTCFLFISVFGEQSIYNFVANQYYYKDTAMLRVFRFLSLGTAISGIWISISLIHKRYKYHDAVIGIVSSVSKILSSLFFCFASFPALHYVGLATDMFNGTALLATVSMYSRLFERKEIGKMNSLVGFIENAVRLVYIPLYWVTYTHTRLRMPGVVYLVGAGVTLPALLVFIWILRREKAADQNQEIVDDIPTKI